MKNYKMLFFYKPKENARKRHSPERMKAAVKRVVEEKDAAFEVQLICMIWIERHLTGIIMDSIPPVQSRDSIATATEQQQQFNTKGYLSSSFKRKQHEVNPQQSGDILEFRSPLQDPDLKRFVKEHNQVLNVKENPSSVFEGKQSNSSCPFKKKQNEMSSRQADPQENQASFIHKYSDRYKPTSYPKVLTNMFGAAECKLCNAKISSPIAGKLHYGGQPHAKRVKMYLINWYSSHKLPFPQDIIVTPSTSQNETNLPDYCEICSVRLPTSNDKFAHYSSKAHRKNQKDPENVYKKRKKSEEKASNDNVRFGIGESFAQTPHSDMESRDDVTPAVFQDPINQMDQSEQTKSNLLTKGSPFACELCSVTLDNDLSFKLHLSGKRHIKNVKKVELDKSGKSYCEKCNVQFTSFQHFQIHINGKKHKKNIEMALN